MLHKELWKYIFLILRNKNAEKHPLAPHFHTYSSYLFNNKVPYIQSSRVVTPPTADVDFNVSCVLHPWALIPLMHLRQIQEHTYIPCTPKQNLILVALSTSKYRKH